MGQKHISVDVFNAKREKLCNLYDSSIDAKGQAHGIVYRKEIGGLKSLSFTLPKIADNKRNYRWSFIRNEYLVRLTYGREKDWFILHAPTREHSKSSINQSIECNHISINLKTKNLYLTFDDDNGIGTIQYLLEQVLKGTGWTLGSCDTFYEKDGVTEKIRSYSSDGKVGAYQLISDICTLFNAYPEYDGENKTVNIHAFNKKGSQFEMTMGKDIESISVEYNSEDIVTRLYVEGEYSDDGYVSIDSVNPTGLSFLMNFDYYKEIGMFTDAHQRALDQYYADIKSVNDTISENITTILDLETALNNNWGQISYVINYRENAASEWKRLIGGTVPDDKKDTVEGDELAVFGADGVYRTVVAGADGSVDYLDSDLYAIKFITLPSGSLGAKQVSVEAKEKLIATLEKDKQKETSEEKIASIDEQIASLRSEINELLNGTEDTVGAYRLMMESVEICFTLRDLNTEKQNALEAQEEIEATLFASMGDMLKEGYWNNVNYAVGQEQLLYDDAVEVLAQMSKPKVTYSLSRVSMAHKMNTKPDDIDVNMKGRIYDPDIQVNDMVYVSAVETCFDRRQDDSIEISNEDLALADVSFESMLTRMTMLADLIEQKNALFSRAEAIGADKTVQMDRLEGTINVLKTKLSSAVSSWYTDDNGNIIFESTTGKSAMMLTGDGFMIAAGKTDEGEWNWRTAGTGQGLVADAIVTGYLSADRIEANSITVNKLASDVGKSLDLSSNTSIKTAVENAASELGGLVTVSETAPENPKMDDLWLDISDGTVNNFKRWNGDQWIETTLSKEDIDDLYGTITSYKTSIEQLNNSITQKVWQGDINASLAGKADESWVTNAIASAQEQTAKDITFTFEQSKQYTEETVNGVQTFIDEIKTYQRFSSDGLELGQIGSPFMAKLGTTKLSFLQNGVEIAYISNNKLYITEAQVTDKLSIGNDTYGYFEWQATKSGLGLKRRVSA